jgi:hypothetical protein
MISRQLGIHLGWSCSAPHQGAVNLLRFFTGLVCSAAEHFVQSPKDHIPSFFFGFDLSAS